jgi:transcriptional regulator with XRE-family HTH domain
VSLESHDPKLSEILEIFADFRSWRKSQGLTALQVSKACGVALSTVRYWEHKRLIPDVKILRELFGWLRMNDEEYWRQKSEEEKARQEKPKKTRKIV